MRNKKILILGAGMAGLSCAWHLQRRKLKSQLFEKEERVGGLCRSAKIGSYIFDISGHLMHFKTDYAFRLTKSLLGNNLIKHRRKAVVYFADKYMPYPFQANLFFLPEKIKKECINGLIGLRNKQKKDPRSYYDFLVSRFGRGIARHFLVPYNEKFWKVSTRKISAKCSRGFLPLPTKEQILENSNSYSDNYIGYNSYFWYPKVGGIEELPKAFSSGIKGINTSSEIKEINIKNRHIVTKDRGKIGFDILVNTIPMPELLGLVKTMPATVVKALKELRWNSILNINLAAKGRENSFHWAYYPQKDICFFRVGLFHAFSNSLAPESDSSLYAEIAYFDSKPIDMRKINCQLKRDLKTTRTISNPENIHLRNDNMIKYGYPIDDICCDSNRRKVLSYLNQNRIYSCGRYGSWKYMSIEDCILDGKRVAESI